MIITLAYKNITLILHSRKGLNFCGVQEIQMEIGRQRQPAILTHNFFLLIIPCCVIFKAPQHF